MKKHIQPILTILLITLFNTIGFSQSENKYYKPAFNKGFTVNINTYYTVFGMQSENQQDSTEFVTNNPLSMSIGIAHPKLPIGISIGYSIKSTLNPEELNTKSFDIQIHNYGRKYVFDASFQKYTGFYTEDFDRKIENVKRPDLSAMWINTIGQYVFNYKKFSYRAAYNRTEMQIKSVGTFLVGGRVSFYDVKSPNFPIYEDDTHVRSLQIGLNGGYAYSLVLKNWLLNGSLSGGASLNKGNIKTAKNKKLYLKPTALARISAFYNAERWSVGVMGIYTLGLPIYTKEERMKMHSARFDISYLYRFDKIK